MTYNTRKIRILSLFLVIFLLMFVATGCKKDPAPADESKPTQSETESISPEDTEPVIEEIDLTGTWESIFITGDSSDFIFVLTFSGTNNIEYLAGWYLSEIAAAYNGTYTLEGNKLVLDMYDAENEMELKGTFLVEMLNDNLVLTNQDGDLLTFEFPKGSPMEFTKAAS